MAKTKKTTKKKAAAKTAGTRKATSKKVTTKKAASRTAATKTSPKAKAYRPFYKYARPARAVTSEFSGDQLQSASRGPDALTALRRFLKQHTPASEEYQDAFHRNRVRAARFELMRLEYLHGNVAAGDKLLAQLQDLDGDDE